ncbi:MAG: hypothetical protein ACREMG_11055 [Gemmatimonadales bacterium]
MSLPQSFRARRSSLGPRFAAVLLAAGLAACSHNPPPSPELGTPQANVLVTVQNQNVNDVDVFAVINGVRQRLGTVVSQSSGSFEIPWDRIGPAGGVSLIAAPIGASGAYRSGRLTIQPGSQVSLTVTPLLRNSIVVVT